MHPVDQGVANSSQSSESPSPSTPQINASAPLGDDGSSTAAGYVESEGLRFKILPDGTAELGAAVDPAALAGDIAIPSAVYREDDSYPVTSVADRALAGCTRVRSVLLPASVSKVGEDAFEGCVELSSLLASSKNETFASFDGMLFSKDCSSLLSIPEGKEGAARIPDQTTAVPACAFSRCTRLFKVEVGEGSATFASRNGILYSKDMKTLMACPPGAAEAAVIPESVEAIASGAFAGCALSSISAFGFVREIAADAFSDEVRAGAVVALPAGKDIEERRAVWEAARFSKFAEPAHPGDAAGPEASEVEGEGMQASGLAYEVQGDYTLAVSWQGPEGPKGDLAIPATAEVSGMLYRVTSVADAGFAGCSGLTGITLPGSISRIGERAFEATGLTEVWLPQAVEAVGSRAFAACSSLGRVVALGSPEVANDALSGCSSTSVYCPLGSKESWNVGLPAAGNHLAAYGVELVEEPLELPEDSTGDLFEGGVREVPEGCKVSYAYGAKSISVENGIVKAKKYGTSEVLVTLELDGIELDRASRTVNVVYGIMPMGESSSGGDWSVHFESNGGEGAMADAHFSASSSGLYQLPKCTFTREGHRFSGWNTKSDNSGTSYADGEQVQQLTNGEAPITLYAQWEVEYARWGNCYWTVDNGEFRLWPVPGTDGAFAPLTPNPAGLPWWSERKNITSVSISPDVVFSGTLKGFFYEWSNLASFDFTGLNITDVTSCENMFNSCSSLESVTFPGDFNTSNITRFDYMFQGCSSLKTLDLSMFDTSKVTYTNFMFDGCSNLESLDLSSFSTSKVVNMSRMFSGCTSLSSLTLSPSFDTSNVTAITKMFYDCPSLNVIPANLSFSNSKFASEGMPKEVFWVPEDRIVPTSYAGSDPLLSGYSWTLDNRVRTDGTLCGTCSWSVENGVLSIWPTDGKSGQLASFGTEGSDTGVPWFDQRSSITAVNIAPGVATGESARSMFMECRMTSLDLTNLDTSHTKSMRNMFYGCRSWKSSLDVSPLDTSSVTDMFRMFYFVSLGSLDLSSFDTSQVTTMGSMFNSAALHSLDMSGWDTSKVEDMSAMFHWCRLLVSLDVSHFNTANARRMDNMFSGYKGTSIDVSNFDTSNCTDMRGMFSSTELVALSLSNFDTSKVVSFGGPTTFNPNGLTGMFQNCPNLTTLDLSSFDTSSAVDMGFMFERCPKLTNLTLPDNFIGPEVVETNGMFANCPSLNVIPANLDFGSLGIPANCFGFEDAVSGKPNLPSAPVKTYYTGSDSKLLGTGPNSYNWASAGRELAGEADIHATGGVSWAIVDTDNDAATNNSKLMLWPTNGVSGTMDSFATDAQMPQLVPWYSRAASIGSVKIFPGVAAGESICNMFNNCANLTSVDLSNLDTSKVTNMAGMFFFCRALESIDFTNFDTSHVTTMKGMFNGCWKLADLDLSGFNTENVTDMSGMFIQCFLLTEVDLSGFNTAKVENMGYLFADCKALPTLDLSSFDTRNVTRMDNMFLRCGSLSTLALPDGFITKAAGITAENAAAALDNLFQGCTQLSLIPANLEFGPLTIPENCFKLSPAPSPLLETYYAGNDAQLKGVGATPYQWAAAGRELMADSFAVSFDSQGGSFVGSQTVAKDASAKAPQNPKRVGYAFAGWYADASCTGQPYDFATPVTSDKTLYAKWEIVEYAVMFNVNGGNPAPLSQTVAHGQAVAKPAADPAQNHYRFEGWYDNAECTGQPYDFSAPVTADLTLHAKWAGGIPSGTCSWLIDNGVLSIWPTDGKSGQLASLDGSVKGAPWYEQRGSITSVNIEPGVAAGECAAYLFVDCRMETLDLSNLDISATTNMSSMFRACQKLKSFTGLPRLDTSNVTDMSGMFFNLSAHSGPLDLSGFDTSKVTSMRSMFNSSPFSAIDMSGWDTSNVTDMGVMFNYCLNLKALDVSHFDTSNVRNMEGMFAYYRGDALDVSGFDTSNVTNMNSMFANTTLAAIDVSRFDTSKVRDMAYMFEGSSSVNKSRLAALDLSSFDTSQVEEMEGLFRGCSALSELILPDNFIGPKVSGVGNLFANCPSLSFVPSNLDFGNLAIPADCFQIDTAPESPVRTYYLGSDPKLRGLADSGNYDWGAAGRQLVKPAADEVHTTGEVSWTIIDGDNDPSTNNSRLVLWPTNGVSGTMDTITGAAPWYEQRTSIGSVEILPGVIANKSIKELFRNCANLTMANVSNLDTSQVVDMGAAFFQCYKLGSLDLSKWSTARLNNLNSTYAA